MRANVMLRKIALGLLLAAVVMTLALAATQFWQYGRAAYPVHSPSDPEEQSRILQTRVDLLAQRLGQVEFLVLVLLASSGLYSIVFVASSFFSAKTFAR